jgi:ACS family tartrate transporter-like MFS transporter
VSPKGLPAVAGEQGTGDVEAIVARVSLRLLPLLFLLYVVNFLDRVNVSFAALQMNRDLGFSASVYGFGAGIFFLGYVGFGIPANALLLRFGVRRWISGIMIAWGLISGLTCFVGSPIQFYVLRTLLGFAEAGFFPGMIYYLSCWFPRRARAQAVARFMTAIPVAGVVGGPLSGLILGLDGTAGMAGWRWLFVLEALPAVVLGFVTLRFLPARPGEAPWLSPSEREALQARLDEEDREQGGKAAGGSPFAALAEPAIWLVAICWFCLLLAGYGIQFWLPQVIKERSAASDLVVGILSSLTWLAGIAGTLLIAGNSDRTGERRLHLAGAVALLIIGLCLGAMTTSLPLTLLAFALAAAGTCGVWGPFWALPAEYIRGPALAAAIALINSIGSVGGFLGPYVMGLLRESTSGYAQGFLVLAAITGVGLASALGLWFRRPPAK